jgi:mutator protein MutT
VKGVLIHDAQTMLLKNERDEWELPGGKLDLGEDPSECVVREIREELALEAHVSHLLDTWVYRIREDRIVLIVTFGMRIGSFAGFRYSHEHKEARIFPVHEVTGLNMPSGYKASIAAYWEATRRL